MQGSGYEINVHAECVVNVNAKIVAVFSFDVIKVQLQRVNVRCEEQLLQINMWIDKNGKCIPKGLETSAEALEEDGVCHWMIRRTERDRLSLPQYIQGHK